MKSKISFFNRTIFQKNLVIFWPIWVGYLIFELLTRPGTLWVTYTRIYNEAAGSVGNNAYNTFEGQISVSNLLEALKNVLVPETMILTVCVVAVISGMALFHYLCIPRISNMVHAFPVTRLELFGTNVANGLLFLMFPQLISFLAMMAVCLSFGMMHVEYLGIFLLMQFCADLIMFSIVAFCAMISGQMFGIPLFFLAVNGLWVMLRLITEMVIEEFSYGIVGAASDSPGDVLSPLYFLMMSVGAEGIYDKNYNLTAIRFTHGGYLAAYLLPAAVIYVAAYLFYRNRELENAGDLVTVDFVRPIFRWGVAFFGAYFLGAMGSIVFVENFVGEGYIRLSYALPTAMVCGSVSFFLAWMLLEKSFHVLKKRTVIECCCFECALLVSVVVLSFWEQRIERIVPLPEEIREVTVTMDLETRMEPEDYAGVVELHRAILGNARWYHRGGDIFSRNETISFRYQLKNGEMLRRNYVVPHEFIRSESFRFYLGRESEPKRFLRSILHVDGENDMSQVTEVLYQRYHETGYYSDALKVYNRGKTELVVIRDLYRALLADAREGVLQKYYLPQRETSDTVPQRYVESISWESDQKDEEYDSYYEELHFGEDCTHLIAFLKKYRFIRSEDELHIYVEEYEE